MKWKSEMMKDQTGKVAIVTGANTGIGYHMANALASKGARVIMACRSEQKAQDAKKRILVEYPQAKVDVRILDLANLESTRIFAKKISSDYERLDLLINNAGVMIPPHSKTKDGFELQFGTNHLGHFALTGYLLSLLDMTQGSRIVTLSSIAHNPGIIDFDDLNSERKRYNKWGAYSQSKIANLTFAIELERRLKTQGSQVISLASHPGYSNTDLQRHSILWQFLNLFFAISPKKGAAPTLFAATESEAKEHAYWGPIGLIEMRGWPGKAKINKKANDQDVAKRLWQVSEELTGVKYLSK